MGNVKINVPGRADRKVVTLIKPLDIFRDDEFVEPWFDQRRLPVLRPVCPSCRLEDTQEESFRPWIETTRDGLFESQLLANSGYFVKRLADDHQHHPPTRSRDTKQESTMVKAGASATRAGVNLALPDPSRTHL